jgi:mono/diheme cytochrome c family protein
MVTAIFERWRMTIRAQQRYIDYGALGLVIVGFTACSFDEAPLYSTPGTTQILDSGAPGSIQGPSTADQPQDPSVIAPGPVLADAGVASPGVDLDDDAAVASDAGVVSAPDAAVTFDCTTSADRYTAIAQTTCAECHGPTSIGSGGFSTVVDIPSLISSGKVIPGNPLSSPLFLDVSNGSMPPPGHMPRPAAQDIETVRGWISCGAPGVGAPVCQTDCSSFVDIGARLNYMVSDLAAQDSEDTRRDIRYLDLTHYANSGASARQIALYRDALSYAMNTLSRSALIVPPQAIDPQQLVYRIRLSDYGWTPANWEQVASVYPYGVTYDPDSRSFPIDDSLLGRLRDQTATQTPYVQGDWFFSHVVRPPLYYDLLGVPATLRALELQLGVDISGNIATQNVARAGFQDSGPSHFNRVIERHALSNDRGVLWLTYDFDAGSGFSNIITHPLDFRPTSSEILFSLANGLHGYMIVDARGLRLDKAPNGSVQDAHANDLAIESGISCINCHAQTGVNVKYDEVHTQGTLTTSVETTNAIVALYKDDPTLDALYGADRARYQAALTATGMKVFTEGSAHALDDGYVELMTAKQIAGVLGITEQQLLAAINASPGIFPAEALSLRAPGSKLSRDRFDAVFAQFVTPLGLGVPSGK